MIQVLVADTSTLSRSTIKEIISKTKRLQWMGEAVSFDTLKAFMRTHKPDILIANKKLFTCDKAAQVSEYCNSANIPSIIFIEPGDKECPAVKNIKYLEQPKFMSFSTQKIEEYAEYLEQQVLDIKCSILFENHPVTTTFTPNGTVSLPLKNISKDIHGKKFRAVLVGVSTGGPGTLATLIKGIGKNFPLPILITQHIDSFFDKNLIVWLNQETSVPVHLAEDNIKPLAGHVYFAPSDVHLTLKPDPEDEFHLMLNHDAPVSFLRPSVDKMFESAARVLGENCIAVVLTGMGADGAKECRHLKDLGAYTITQDQATCVIYGMPKAAYEAGGSCEVLPLGQIAQRLWSLTKPDADKTGG